MRFGPYEVVQELARGGMGAVYVVVHVETGVRYALKTLLPAALGEGEERVRFIREARALAQLQHPNLVRVFSAESEGPRPYLVQELLPGGSLQDRLLRQGPLPREEALELTLQLASALELAHGQGILHRDLKPANVLVAEDGSARLADFGLAKRLHDESIRLTKTGQLLGTPAYMAPEQANGRPSDARTDVYGLAAILYALLSGQPPFSAKSLMGVLQKVMDEAPPPLADQPPALRAVIAKALSKEAHERPESMRAFADELRRAREAGEVGARLPAWGLALAALLGLGALTLALAASLASPAPAPSARPSLVDVSPSPALTQGTPTPSPTASAGPPPPLSPRPRIPLSSDTPLGLAYSPDASFLGVVQEVPGHGAQLRVYDAASGQPLPGPPVDGVAQLALRSGGDFVVGRKRALVFGRGPERPSQPLSEGTLEHLAVDPKGERVLATLEDPSGLALHFAAGFGQKSITKPCEGEPYGLVVWLDSRRAFLVRHDEVRLAQVRSGPRLEVLEDSLPLPGFTDPTAGLVWRETLFLGNGLGRVLAIRLGPEGLPAEVLELKRQASQGSLLELRAHTARIHAFLVASDPPHVVSVARTHGDPATNGALARWGRSGAGPWSFQGDVIAPRGQVCMTQGGAEREWVALALSRPSGTYLVEQRTSKRYLRR